jgi:hypothetical protein
MLMQELFMEDSSVRSKEILPSTDQWIWGREVLIWGHDQSHQYTCKVLRPKVGRLGMLSLQYHHEKSESWIQLSGRSWALVISNGKVCTRILNPGDVQNIELGMIHRLMGLTEDCQILEPSTPDRHAADKSVPKDVVRLHCVLGRDVSNARNDSEARLVDEAIRISHEALNAIDAGRIPEEINVSELLGKTGFRLAL